MRTYLQKPTGGFARRNPISNFEFVFRAIADRLGLSYEELAAANGYKQLTSILGIFRPFGYTTTYACLSFIETLRDLGATRDEVRMLLETHLAEIVNVTLIKRLKPEARELRNSSSKNSTKTTIRVSRRSVKAPAYAVNASTGSARKRPRISNASASNGA